MLVAVRTWKHIWSTGRVCITLQGDSVTALYMMADVKSKSEVNVHIAREIALELGSAIYRPDKIQHIPGLTNQVPDFLSRCMVPPRSQEPLPDALRCAKEVKAAVRDDSWYLAGIPPAHRAEKRSRA